MLEFIYSITPYFLIAVVFISGCASTHTATDRDPSLSSIEWLLGNWENVSPKRTLCEQWKKIDDSTFAGQSFVVKNSDTTYLESIRLQKRAGIISYNPTVPDQNEGKTIQFNLTAVDRESFTFENPRHDFPQKLVYMHKEDGSLHAHLEGVEEGKEKIEDFYMKRAR